MKIKFVFYLVFLMNFAFGQINQSNILLNVLRKNAIGKEFNFGKWNEKGELEVNLTFLGSIKSKGGKNYKIMNSVLTWGISGRETCRILVFNGKNQYIGNYYLFDSCNLPIEVKNGYLIFNSKRKECDGRIKTKINLNYGLPKNILGYNFEN